jgi:hypothetical protein
MLGTNVMGDRVLHARGCSRHGGAGRRRDCQHLFDGFGIGCPR